MRCEPAAGRGGPGRAGVGRRRAFQSQIRPAAIATSETPWEKERRRPGQSPTGGRGADEEPALVVPAEELDDVALDSVEHEVDGGHVTRKRDVLPRMEPEPREHEPAAEGLVELGRMDGHAGDAVQSAGRKNDGKRTARPASVAAAREEAADTPEAEHHRRGEDHGVDRVEHRQAVFLEPPPQRREAKDQRTIKDEAAAQAWRRTPRRPSVPGIRPGSSACRKLCRRRSPRRASRGRAMQDFQRGGGDPCGGRPMRGSESTRAGRRRP